MIKRVLTYTAPLIDSNIYFVENDSGDCLMIDCGAFDDGVKNFIARHDLKVSFVLLTHGHYDHIAGVKSAINEHIAPLIYKYELELVGNERLNLSLFFGRKFTLDEVSVLEDGKVTVGSFEVEVIPTPGHTVGSVCYKIGDTLFSGDTLFYHSFGRYDFPTGDKQTLFKSLKKLFSLDGDVKVYPGHGQPTTIAAERDHFTFLW